MYILYKDTSRTLSTILNKQNTALYEHQQQFIWYSENSFSPYLDLSGKRKHDEPYYQSN